MQPTNIEGIAKDAAAAVMGNPIVQVTFSPGAEQDGFESDLRIELTRVLASHPAIVRFVPPPLLPLQDHILEGIVLATFEAMGGEGDSSEYKHHWLNLFWYDERPGVEDTFNRCNTKGWLHTTQNTDIDASTTTLTPAGRAHLAEMRRTPAKTEPAAEDTMIAALLLSAINEAKRAMRAFPQPNYNITKVAEECGEVIKAAVHCAEGRDTPEHVVLEIRQAIAMLIRLYVEGDQVHGLPPLFSTASPEIAP